MRNVTITLLLTYVFLISATAVFAQAPADTAAEKIDKIFVKEEVQPSFKGGLEALNKYLAENVDMQHVQQDDEAYVYFVVSAKGNVYRVQMQYNDITFNSVKKSLLAAIEKSSGMWNSGMQNDHHVTAHCKLKVKFGDGRIETEIEE